MQDNDSRPGVQIPIYGIRDGLTVIVTYALVSSESAALVSSYRWNLTKAGYAYRKRSRKEPGTRQIYMHRLLMKFPVSGIDHINRDKLDNRLSNLRVVTQGQNNQNKLEVNKLGYKGIYFNKNTTNLCYRASISHEKKAYSLGSYRTAKEAAAAYNSAALKLYGVHALINQL